MPRLRFLTVAALTAALSSLQAADFYWDPNLTASASGGSGTWAGSAANWYDGVSANVAWGNTASDIAHFAGTAGTVTFGFSPTGALSFETTGYVLQNSLTTQQTISGQVSLAAASTTINLNTTGSGTVGLLVSGKITGTGAINLTSTSGAARNVQFGGTGTNDFSGGTSVGNGIRLNLATATATAGTGTITVASGGQLFSGAANGTIANAISVGGSGWSGDSTQTFGAIRLNSTTLTGPVTLTAATKIGGGTGTNTISGTIAGAFALSLGATGGAATTTYNLSGDNTYSGATTLNNPTSGGVSVNLTGSNASSGYTIGTLGTLNIGGTAAGGSTGSILSSATIANAGTLRFNLAGSQTVSGVISGAGSVMQSGGGVTTFSGVNTYTGTTRVDAGTLTVSGAINLNAVSGVTIASGATLALSGTLNTTSASGTLQNNGTLNLGGTLDLKSIFDTFNGGASGSYTLVTGSGTTSGNFGVVTGYDTSVWSNVVYSAGALVFTAVPEPADWASTALGALALAAIVRRRRRA